MSLLGLSEGPPRPMFISPSQESEDGWASVLIYLYLDRSVEIAHCMINVLFANATISIIGSVFPSIFLDQREHQTGARGSQNICCFTLY